MHDLNPPKSRRGLIADRLAAGHSVSASALAQEFATSEDTIRRDLRALSRQGLCERVYGGALPISPAGAGLTQRLAQGLPEKQALARVALPLMTEGMSLFLDGGSTNLQLALLLPPLMWMWRRRSRKD